MKYLFNIFFILISIQAFAQNVNIIPQLKKIEAGEVKLKPGETIKLVSHSQGSAYANGMAKVLINAGYCVEVSYNIAPKDPGDIDTPYEIERVVQYSSPNDFIARQENMSGATEFIDDAVPSSEQGVVTGGGHTVGSYHDGRSNSSSLDQTGIFNIPQDDDGAVLPRQDAP